MIASSAPSPMACRRTPRPRGPRRLLPGWGLWGLGLLALGCAASGPPAPGWLHGERPPAYPEQRFLTAVASGSSLENARVNAKGELSRIFSTELRSEIELIEHEQIVDGRATRVEETTIDTSIGTALELEGTEVPLHWRDPRSGEVWALAVLDREDECRRLRAEGRERITRLDGVLADLDAAASPLVGVRAARQALGLGRSLDALEARSRVLGLRCVEGRPRGTGAIAADLESRLRALSFVVQARAIDVPSGRTEPLPQLRELIAGNLTRAGFQVGPARDSQVVPIEATVRLARVSRGTDWVEYRWEGSAAVAGPRVADAVLLTAEGEGSESHPEPSTARLRARRAAEAALAQALDGVLRAFLEEESGS